MKEPNTGKGSWVEKLLSTTNAHTWASEFMSNIGTAGFVIDQDLMIGWFANAIETGKSHERRRLITPAATSENKHAFWQAVETAARDRTLQQKALTAAVILISVRGDIYLKDENGNDVAGSSLTMERIFDLLVATHDRTLLPAQR